MSSAAGFSMSSGTIEAPAWRRVPNRGATVTVPEAIPLELWRRRRAGWLTPPGGIRERGPRPPAGRGREDHRVPEPRPDRPPGSGACFGCHPSRLGRRPVTVKLGPSVAHEPRPRVAVVGAGGNAIDTMVAARPRGHPPEEETMTPTGLQVSHDGRPGAGRA